MKYLKFIIPGFALVIAILAVVFLAGPSVVDHPKSGRNIIAFGDDLVTGYGVKTIGDDFASLLSKRFDTHIINAGANADTTAAAVGRLDRDVLPQNPKIVIVLLGRNDTTHGTPREETLKNLGTIIDRIHAKGAAVILVDSRGDLKSLSRDKKVNYVSLKADKIAPNDAGHAMIADSIEPLLKKLLN